jgi:hypothetical protein
MSDFAPEWLALREPADARARAVSLLDPLLARLRAAHGDRDLVVRDLGSGTGSMSRWLTHRLPGPQEWILTDRDPILLAVAAASLPAAVLEVRDLTLLTADDLAGTDLVTGSALLDLLTEVEVTRLAEACVTAGCPALLTLSVAGRVTVEPPHPLDEDVTRAFNDHQRRTVDGRSLLGPDAVAVTAAAFERAGAVVHRAPSPWRLGPDQADLTAAWLRGWVSAAGEQDENLHPGEYLRRRLAQCAAGELTATVHHEDLLALPPGAVAGVDSPR